jgi:hypothetical protein
MREESVRRSTLRRSSGSTNTMNVVFRSIRKIVIDHEFNVVNVWNVHALRLDKSEIERCKKKIFPKAYHH